MQIAIFLRGLFLPLFVTTDQKVSGLNPDEVT